jgi:hypothetical protein
MPAKVWDESKVQVVADQPSPGDLVSIAVPSVQPSVQVGDLLNVVIDAGRIEDIPTESLGVHWEIHSSGVSAMSRVDPGATVPAEIPVWVMEHAGPVTVSLIVVRA